MKTIIQTIGPVYGEIVNGTVFGQPNGSEAVLPLRIDTVLVDANKYVTADGAAVKTCTSDGTAAAVGTYVITAPVPVEVKFALYSDSGCTTLVTALKYGGPQMGWSGNWSSFQIFGSSVAITPGTTYYGRIELYQGTDMIKALDAVELVGV